MAILTCLPGLEVTVEVDGQRAHEYDADPEEVESRAEEMDFHLIPPTYGRCCFKAPYVLKYIEAKPGKPFIFVVDMTNRRVFDWDMEPGQRLSYAFEGGDGSDAEKAKKYGTLLVKLFLGVETGRMEAPADRAGPPLIYAVHEKDLKGRAVDSKVSILKCVDPRGRPIAVFEFRYRTMEGLYQEGVIRRPRPVVVKDDDMDEEVIDVDDDDEEEDKQQRTIKREPENDASSSQGIIKREASTATTDGGGGAQLATSTVSYKLRRLEDGKVETWIDLTDD
ncbi:hypothetical protein QBC32DRAFT_403768 [Pseudoneurospora amorphoporcata]|uniref:DUF7918 domain-containing protein n=1 Tax=Pseudoneurospora amorphoporcata TaxID=241081 RepID=A0AAN6SIU0_9PEZI|nr:hypothetical protein QBC32DRAFT_403768 [Pseudoneurospora amorphoporcata]